MVRLRVIGVEGWGPVWFFCVFLYFWVVTFYFWGLLVSLVVSVGPTLLRLIGYPGDG